MRSLIILRGAPGCGKSTWIKENNLEQYTISPDNIRLLFQTPTLQINGTFGISQKNDSDVWKFVFEILERRMARGEFSIVDATHGKSNDFTQYKKLADTYRYRLYCIDFSDVPIDVCKERNNSRVQYKRVPDDVIDRKYSQFTSFNIPGAFKIIDKNNFEKDFLSKPIDFSKYDEIIHIGDMERLIALTYLYIYK